MTELERIEAETVAMHRQFMADHEHDKPTPEQLAFRERRRREREAREKQLKGE